jgi:hydroxypyruvate reductase/glycerate 2-kinase
LESAVSSASSPRLEQAKAIWDAAVAAARPEALIRQALANPAVPLHEAVDRAPRILVVGGGKAGAAMSAAVEDAVSGSLGRMEGIVNVPAESVRPLRAIHLHAGRPVGTNQPTAEGVEGTCRMLHLVATAGPQDVALCLLSGGGSALLPAPVEDVSLVDKQKVTQFLHECGATINEMNTVRKHLSRCKGGRLAQAFTGRTLFSLIISDVVGDPLDVIASGPTAADPTTFADALSVLTRFGLTDRVPAGVLRYLTRGAAGQAPETLKVLPDNIHNYIVGNNAKSLAAARAKAGALGYAVLNLGSYIEGETHEVATAMAGVVRSIRANGQPLSPPACILSGGETTVTLAAQHGLGGRNQEFVLALAAKLDDAGLEGVVILSGGTDGEDGPTDAAGAAVDLTTWRRAHDLGLSPAAYLACKDSYHFFHAVGGLLQTGLTQTNVMDVRVVLVA